VKKDTSKNNNLLITSFGMSGMHNERGLKFIFRVIGGNMNCLDGFGNVKRIHYLDQKRPTFACVID